MDAINVRMLTPSSYDALMRISEEHHWPEVQPYMQAEDVALLTFRLQEVKDSEENFPKGKWATIQCLQSFVKSAVIIEKCAQKAGRQDEGN